ncbi:hypothetical protein AYJ57_21470 (plasmid) [Salipiger sp. CCB-MM3]|nr:hypothetical protein AYJ57_21470 [Salipiger sp. CCB-MM3]
MLSSVYLEFSRTPAGWYYGAWLSKIQNQDWEFLKSQSSHQLIPDTATGRSEGDLDSRKDYAYLRGRTGVGRRVGVRLNEDAVWFDALSIGLSSSKKELSDIGAHRARFLLPHLTKAVEMGRVFSLLRARYRSALAAIDRVQAGVAIALQDGQIVVMNAEAERIFDLDDGMALGRDAKIVTTRPDVTSKVQSHIVEVSATALGQGGQHEFLVSVERKSGLTPFLLDVAPIRDCEAEIEKGLDGALVTIIDPENIPYLRLDRFTKLYGLTQAETDVCRLIADGAAVQEIAERRGTSPVTAKNQVAAILAKTSVRSRAELIRLILRVLPPVA